MSEYPDHLNPFKESEKKKLGRTLRRSFREFKGFVRQSFRKKKSDGNKNSDSDENVEMRKSLGGTPYNTLRYQVMSLPSSPTYSTNTLTSPPLPRSRFKERLSRSSLHNTYNSPYDEKCNPFAEDDGLNPFDDPPIPYRRKKSKKRAPLPPSVSNPDVNLGNRLTGSSKWSLTSSETDYTFDDKSEYSGDVTYSQSLRECLDNFNKEMDTLNKESLEIGGSTPNILRSNENEQTFEETDQFTTKQRHSIDSVDLEDTKEINNNEHESLDAAEIIPETSETKIPIIVISENDTSQQQKNTEDETPNQEDSRESHLTEAINEIHPETLNSEVEHEIIDDIPVETNENILDDHLDINKAVIENQNFRNFDDMKKSYFQPESIPEATEEEEIEAEIESKDEIKNNYILNGKAHPINEQKVEEKDIQQTLDLDELEIKYIDEEHFTSFIIEKNGLNTSSNHESFVAEKSNSEEISPTPKHRKFKLDKVVLLGEECAPK